MATPEAEAQSLLQAAGVDGVPVAVEALARSLGLQVVYQPLEDEVSGLLYRDGKTQVIGVNSRQAATRQRFTIAHELGHWRLHKGRDVRVDRAVRVNFRHERLWDQEEGQANAFAAALLMPQSSFTPARLEVLKGSPARLDLAIHRLASAYQVSPQAMTIRLTGLGVLDPT
jgi:Zn-dependent peptidase ImmA (M78 family)